MNENIITLPNPNIMKKNGYLAGYITLVVLVLMQMLVISQLHSGVVMNTMLCSAICTILLALYIGKKYSVLNRGLKGEHRIVDELQELSKDYKIINNVPITWHGRRSEIDTLVIGENGIWIVEVKNYRGTMNGSVGANTWNQTKKGMFGVKKVKEMRNPLKQLNNQKYILSNMLKDFGFDVKVNGFVIFPTAIAVYVDSTQIYLESKSLKHKIEHNQETKLEKDVINQIVEVIVKK